MAEIDSQGVFHFSRADADYRLVCKCKAAAEAENLSGLTSADFEAALDAVAKALSEQAGLSYHAAYSAVLDTATGQTLYSGYLRAKPPAPKEAVEKSDDGPESWQQIECEANSVRRQMNRTISKEAAIALVLKENPELYSDYLRETNASRWQHDPDAAA